MSDEFAVVYSAWSVEMANLARIHLADEGIESYLTDDQTIAMDWSLSNSIHGVKLRVRQADSDRARKILNSIPEIALTDEDVGVEETPDLRSEHEFGDAASSSDRDDNDRPSPNLFASMRSVKGVVIYLFIIPFLFSMLVMFSAMVASFLRF